MWEGCSPSAEIGGWPSSTSGWSEDESFHVAMGACRPQLLRGRLSYDLRRRRLLTHGAEDVCVG